MVNYIQALPGFCKSSSWNLKISKVSELGWMRVNSISQLFAGSTFCLRQQNFAFCNSCNGVLSGANIKFCIKSSPIGLWAAISHQILHTVGKWHYYYLSATAVILDNIQNLLHSLLKLSQTKMHVHNETVIESGVAVQKSILVNNKEITFNILIIAER